MVFVKQMTPVERAKALGLLSAGFTQREVALECNRSRAAISKLAKKAREVGFEKALKVLPGRGRKTLATLGDIRKMIRLVQQRPFLSSKEVKRLMGPRGEKFSVRRVQELLNKAGYKSRHAARKPMLTERMKAQRMEFATSHLHWTKEEWSKVSFTNESTFRLVRGGIKFIRRARGGNRSDQWYCRKTVKHSVSIMVWGMFDGPG